MKVRAPSQAIWEENPVFNFAANDNEIVNSLLYFRVLARTYSPATGACASQRSDGGRASALNGRWVLTRALAET